MTEIDTTRRALLLGGASLAAGCCTMPVPQVAGLCPPGGDSFLAGPEVQQAWAGQARHFDAHTHFFNAADVPVAGFLAKSVAHSLPDPALRELLVALAPIAELVGKALAPTPRQEMDLLCAATAQARSLAPQARADGLDAAIEARQREVGSALFEEIARRDTPIPALVDDAVQRVRGLRAESLLLDRPSFSREFVQESVRRGSAPVDGRSGKWRPLAKDRLVPEENRLASIQNAFQFVGFMLSPRHHNLRTYIRRFHEGSPGLPLSGCFAAMVDFNHWLDCPGKASHLRDQVLVHEQLSLLSGGFLLPLVAYNPWVDIVDDDAGLKTVEWAVREHGCVGVKIYPPMGFYPYGNEGVPIPGSREPRPDLRLLDEKLARFFARCEELDVPVMAHANASNGRDAPHDALAGVRGWKALDALPGRRTLFVNAGHFGDTEDHGGSDWTADFAALMHDARRLRVYGDLGFWDELLTSADVQERLRRVLRQPVGDGASVADRTLYGSDWLMLSQVPGWERYGAGIADVLRALDPGGPLAAKVLGDNVLQCYGLAPDSPRQNRRRLLERAAGAGGRLPGWMQRPA